MRMKKIKYKTLILLRKLVRKSQERPLKLIYFPIWFFLEIKYPGSNEDAPRRIILFDGDKIYIRITKCMSTTIDLILRSNFKTRKLNEEEFEDLKEECFVFTFVRNPYSRIISSYNHMINRGNITKEITIKDFVKKISKTPIKSLDQHFKPQITFIKEKKVKIFRIEDLPMSWDNLKRTIPSLPSYGELPIVNKNQGKIDVGCLDKETKELIYNKFNKDFEIGGYKR